jgi:hypothetical protein
MITEMRRMAKGQWCPRGCGAWLWGNGIWLHKCHKKGSK